MTGRTVMAHLRQAHSTEFAVIYREEGTQVLTNAHVGITKVIAEQLSGESDVYPEELFVHISTAGLVLASPVEE